MLSLDVNVQEVVERYLNEAIAANTVENRGCAIVMDVNTGAILAMASKPDFDPNDPLSYEANLAYLNELVRAEPELYGIYRKTRTAALSPMKKAIRSWTRRRITPAISGISSGKTRPLPSCITPAVCSR